MKLLRCARIIRIGLYARHVLALNADLQQVVALCAYHSYPRWVLVFNVDLHEVLALCAYHPSVLDRKLLSRNLYQYGNIASCKYP